MLSAAASSGFGVVLTVDQRLRSQQNPANLPIPVIVLRARSNTLGELRPLVPSVLRLLDQPLARGVVDVFSEAI